MVAWRVSRLVAHSNQRVQASRDCSILAFESPTTTNPCRPNESKSFFQAIASVEKHLICPAFVRRSHYFVMEHEEDFHMSTSAICALPTRRHATNARMLLQIVPDDLRLPI